MPGQAVSTRGRSDETLERSSDLCGVRRGASGGASTPRPRARPRDRRNHSRGPPVARTDSEWPAPQVGLETAVRMTRDRAVRHGTARRGYRSDANDARWDVRLAPGSPTAGTPSSRTARVADSLVRAGGLFVRHMDRCPPAWTGEA